MHLIYPVDSIAIRV